MNTQINDNINPKHYKQGKVETINHLQDMLTDEEFKGFCKGVALQYIARANYKNGLEDYKKARWYLDKLIKVMEHKK